MDDLNIPPSKQRKSASPFFPSASITSGHGDWNTDISSSAAGLMQFDSWIKMFVELVRFKTNHGHFAVPEQGCDEYPGLGQWVALQRRQHSQVTRNEPSLLTPSRRQMLDSIGFRWTTEHQPTNELSDENTDAMLNVSSPQAVINNIMMNGTMADIKLAKTAANLFPWELHFENLKIYKNKYGNSLVPMDYKEQPLLGAWVEMQRQECHPSILAQSNQNTKSNRAGPSKFEKMCLLNTLDFEWDAPNVSPDRPSPVASARMSSSNSMLNMIPMLPQKRNFSTTSMAHDNNDMSTMSARQIRSRLNNASSLTASGLPCSDGPSNVPPQREMNPFAIFSPVGSINPQLHGVRQYSAPENDSSGLFVDPFSAAANGMRCLPPHVMTNRQPQQQARSNAANTMAGVMVGEDGQLLLPSSAGGKIMPLVMENGEQRVAALQEMMKVSVPPTAEQQQSQRGRVMGAASAPGTGHYNLFGEKFARMESRMYACDEIKKKMRFAAMIKEKGPPLSAAPATLPSLKTYSTSDSSAGRVVTDDSVTANEEKKSSTSSVAPAKTPLKTPPAEEILPSVECKNDTIWWTRFGELQDFIEENGHSFVPFRFPPNPALGNWVSMQRRQHKSWRKQQSKKHQPQKSSHVTSMTEKRVDALEQLGFQWVLKPTENNVLPQDSKRSSTNDTVGVLPKNVKPKHLCQESSGVDDDEFFPYDSVVEKKSFDGQNQSIPHSQNPFFLGGGVRETPMIVRHPMHSYKPSLVKRRNKICRSKKENKKPKGLRLF